jgi:ribosomal protein L34
VGWTEEEGTTLSGMHYPRRNSKIKRARRQGFRARMRTPGGRKMINRKRRNSVHKISVC